MPIFAELGELCNILTGIRDSRKCLILMIRLKISYGLYSRAKSQTALATGLLGSFMVILAKATQDITTMASKMEKEFREKRMEAFKRREFGKEMSKCLGRRK